MANTLAALKNLPCPAGNSCTAFQCLFSHERDSSHKSNSGVNTESVVNQNTLKQLSASRPSPSVENTIIPPAEEKSKKRSKLNPVENTSIPPAEEQSKKRVRVNAVENTIILPAEEQSRKRMKLNPDGIDTSLKGSSASNSSPDIRPKEQRKDTVPNMPLDPDGRLGLLRRKPPQSIQSAEVSKQTVAHQVKSKPSVNSLSTTSNDSPKTKPALVPKQSNKGPETLNPRLLQKAPAGHSTRVALIKALHKEFTRLNDELKKSAKGAEKKLILSDQELIVKTLDEEQDIAVKKTTIYNTSIRSRIMVYKRMTLAQWVVERTKATESDNSDDTKSSSSEEPISTGLNPAQEVKFLSRMVFNLSDLEAHGYISKIPSDEDIRAAEAGVEACGNTETCDRCTRRFQVFPGRRESDGALATNGPCTYHPGKPYYLERAKNDRSERKRKYRCCQMSYGDEAGGCKTSQHHVFKTTDPKRLASVLNFVETPVNPKVPTDRAVCFDCEMGYTVYGLELIRLTAVSFTKGDILLDILVQPVGEILDLNTRFSGVRPEDITLAEKCGVGMDHKPTIIPSDDPNGKPQSRLKMAPSPKVARDLLFTIISADTPLIGHGLENDLNAVRIIHHACIDTVILWPHTRGLPMRNGLKYLMQSKLNRQIQVDSGPGSPEGHDSAEDARAAGELVRLKMRDEWTEMKMKGWTMDHLGNILAPEGEFTLVGGPKMRK